MASQNRRDSQGHVDPYAGRRRRYESVLKPFGLADAFARLSRRAQEAIWKRKFPDPVLEFSASFPADRHLRRAVETALREAAIDIDSTKLLVRDFLAVIVGLHLTIQGTKDLGCLPPELAAFLSQAKPIMDRCFREHLDQAFAALGKSLARPLLAQSRLDTRLLLAQFGDQPCGAGKDQICITAASAPPQAAYVTIDGDSRPVYRVGSTLGGSGVQWISWDGAALGLPGPQQYPVFVQSHALRQLRTRVNLPAAAPYLECWLAESLREPKIVERHGDQLWLEYRLIDQRVGYLVARVVGGRVVVRTFLFLTMQGAPEARRLQRQMGLARPDVEWLRLSELSAFTQTDLRNDPELRAMFQACGCGHLFDLADSDCALAPQSYAGELRRYLGMAA